MPEYLRAISPRNEVLLRLDTDTPLSARQEHAKDNQLPTRGKQIFYSLLLASLLTATAAISPGQAQVFDPASPLFAPAGSDDVLVQLVGKSREQRGFCLDFPGFPISGTVSEYREASWPIGAHTCKTNIEHANIAMLDQLFSSSELTANQHLRFTRLKVCAEVLSFSDVKAPGHLQESWIRQDAQIVANPCVDRPSQQFVLDSSGRIKSVLDYGKCLTIGREWFEAGERSPGQPWYRRGPRAKSRLPI
jgi:hypothetical protein